MSRVSIAIPTYNRREYLKECLKSILNQSFQDFEIIIFDNHSDYDIEELVSQFDDKRIKLIINEKNLGNRGNFRKIVNYKFNSKYVMIFHDDDTMHPLLLEKEVKVLEANPDVVFVATELKFIKDPKKMNDFVKLSKRNKSHIFKDTSSFLKLIFSDFDLCSYSTMYRLNTFEDYPSFDERFFKRFFKWSDRPYLIELSKKGKVAVLKEKLVNYRLHKEQDSRSESLDKNDYAFNLLLFYKENLPQPLSKKDKKLFHSFATNNLILAGFSFSKNWQEYKKFLEQAKNKNLFRLKYLNFRGVYYFLRGIKNLYFRK